MTFEEDAMEELDTAEKKELEQNESIKQLITSIKSRYVILKEGECELKLVSSITKVQRNNIEKLFRLIEKYETLESIPKGKEKEIDTKVKKLLYNTLASLCIESPFNEIDTWAQVEEETEGTAKLFFRMVKAIAGVDEDIKSFR